MKRIILNSIVFLITSLLLTSCMTLQHLPLTGTYLDKPYEIVSDKKFEQVWVNVIDLFATKGLSIKLIDKSSGLIISEKTSFINDYSFEDNTGKLENPEASVVIEKITYSGYNQFLKPEKIIGEWNIRIKDNGSGKTIVNVNLTNIDATSFIAGSQYSPAQNLTFNGKSTGKFEELITTLIK
jgi:hypothetical protein